MRAKKAQDRVPIEEVVTAGSCPICSARKHFQSSLQEALDGIEGAGLCNHHAWVLARSFPAEKTADIFL